MITVLAVLGRLMRPRYDEGATAATQAAATASHRPPSLYGFSSSSRLVERPKRTDSRRSTQGSCPSENPGFCSSRDRKSTRLNSSHDQISYAVFCLKKKKNNPVYCVTSKH